MSLFYLILYSLCVLFPPNFLTLTALGCAPWCPYQYFQQSNRRFERKTDRFWEFNEQADRWIQVQLPSPCEETSTISYFVGNVEEEYEVVDVVPLRQRKRLSLTKAVAGTSVWVSGESGSIYERFWNGLQWVIAPHELPATAGPAVAVFAVNHTLLALTESGNLYQVRSISFRKLILF